MRFLKMLPFLLVLFAIISGLCWYMARRTLALSPFFRAHSVWIYGFFALFLVAQFGVPLLHRIPVLAHHTNFLYWFSFGLLGFVSVFLIYLLSADLLQFLVRRIFHAPPAFAHWAVVTAVFLALLSATAGLITALRPVRLHRIEVPIMDLPPGLEGFRIIQISDLHLGPTTRWRQISHLVDLSNAQRPDLVAVTGDLVDGEADGTRAKAALLGSLQARHGIAFITGNHEYYSGVRPWLEMIHGMGWRVLLNEHEVIQHEGASLVLVGLPDPAARSRRPGRMDTPGQGPDLAKALAGAPAEGMKILLYHQPLLYREAERAGVRLQLSGHTHGGQYFPYSLLVQRIFAYPLGLNRHGNLWIHTSPGTGFWGPPNRFLVPPELTLLVLRRA